MARAAESSVDAVIVETLTNEALTADFANDAVRTMAANAATWGYLLRMSIEPNWNANPSYSPTRTSSRRST